MLIALGGFVAVAGMVAAMYFTTSGGVGAGGVVSSLLGGSAVKFQVAQDLAWFDRYTKPLAVDITGDGVEDLIAIYSKPDKQGYVGAFNGKDFTQLWSAGPFGESEAANGKLKAALAGKRLLITDFQGNATLYELSTGAQVKSFPQEDVVSDICGAPPGESIAWIKPPGLLINGDDTTTSFGQPPDRCREYSSYDSNRTGLEWHNFRGSSSNEKPKFPKFDSLSSFEDARQTYVLAKEKTGYQQHYLLRYEVAEIKESIAIQPFAPDAKELMLQLDSHRFGGSFIQDGRFLFFYQEKSDRFYPTVHAVSVDLATKQKVFDVRIDLSSLIPSSQNTITKDRLYIVDQSRLHIFNAKTGEYIAIFGK